VNSSHQSEGQFDHFAEKIPSGNMPEKMALSGLMQCETRWHAVLASFDEQYEVLMVDHADARKEIDSVRAAIVQIGQLVQKSPKMNGNGAKWKELANRAEAVSNAPCKHMGGKALFAGLLHLYAAVCKEMWGSLQLNSMESGQDGTRQPEQTKR
jgi:hypothetical protein